MHMYYYFVLEVLARVRSSILFYILIREVRFDLTDNCFV